MKRLTTCLTVTAVLFGSALLGATTSPLHAADPPVYLAGLQDAASLTVDRAGVNHIAAGSIHDMFFLNGWVHARDRLFQMDTIRRQASGTLAELVGKPALASDVQARTIGLRRAAERTWAAATTDMRQAVQAYADGVNAYVANHPLPPEYDVLHASFLDWTPIDTMTVAKAWSFQLSFDLDIVRTVQLQAYIAALPAKGVDLFTEDVMRSQPFTDTVTVPGAIASRSLPAGVTRQGGLDASSIDLSSLDEAARLGRAYLAKVADDPFLAEAIHQDGAAGSNMWVVAGQHTLTGRPLLASDGHIFLSWPATLYPVGLKAEGIDVQGDSFAGMPGVLIGHNRWFSLGGSDATLDVTDTYLEKVVKDPASPSGLATIYNGNPEAIIPIPETFRYNDNGTITTATRADDVPAATLIVPRRNQGPIIQLDGGAALSVQYAGFSPTFELQAFLDLARARNLSDFEDAARYYDVGALNIAYADVQGNIAYVLDGEMPVREDLQAGTVHGLPPWFIRNGQGGNEWQPVQHRQPQQALPYEIYPAAEMPHVVNPPAGWLVSANNDPIGVTLDNDPINQMRPGGGIYYLGYTYYSFRAARITDMLRQRLEDGGKVSVADMRTMQADVALVDAAYFVPHIVAALEHARGSAVPDLAAFASDPAVTEAVGRLSRWDFSTPTGLAEGYDAHYSGEPREPEIAASVAATIYALWRSQAVAKIIDAPLGPLPKPEPDDKSIQSAPGQTLTAIKHLLDTFDTTHGVGASGINFFVVPGIDDPAAARDYLLLDSMRTGLNRLASVEFAAAFHQSTDQNTYRWGLLHRITFNHPLGGPFSVPPAFGQFPAPLPDLTGIPVDGGFQTVDSAYGRKNLRGTGVDAFTFDIGPFFRKIDQLTPDNRIALAALPGGISADPASPYYVNLLRPYLLNQYYPAPLATQLRRSYIVATMRLIPVT